MTTDLTTTEGVDEGSEMTEPVPAAPAPAYPEPLQPGPVEPGSDPAPPVPMEPGHADPLPDSPPTPDTETSPVLAGTGQQLSAGEG